MCQPKPGPRCAAHTRRELAAAKAAYVQAVEDERPARIISRAEREVAAAQAQYDSTPTGQRELEAAMAATDDAYERTLLRNRFVAAVSLREEQTRALAAVREREARAAADGRPVDPPVVVPGGRPTRVVNDTLYLSDADAAALRPWDQTPMHAVKQLGDRLDFEYDDYACSDPWGCSSDGICRDKRYEGLRPHPDCDDPAKVAAALLNTSAPKVPDVVVAKVRELGLVGSDNWVVEASSDYYGQRADMRPVDEYDMADRVARFRDWFYKAGNANDYSGVLAYVRSKGTVTAGRSPVEAIRAQLRAENPGARSELVEQARTAEIRSLSWQDVIPNEDRLAQVRPSAAAVPKGAAPGTQAITGVVVASGGRYLLVDGHRRYASVRRGDILFRPFVVLT